MNNPRHLILAAAAAFALSMASMAARADGPAPATGPAMIDTTRAEQATLTVGDVVDRMTPGMQRHLSEQMVSHGVAYERIRDVRVRYDAATGKVTVVGDPDQHKPHELFFVGAQLGILFPFGLEGLMQITVDGHPHWDVDVLWEPSAYMQSYSVGGAWHPFHNAVFIGARLRDVQLHAPWSRGYSAEFDNQFAVGGEIGLRGELGQSRLLGSFSVGAFYVLSDRVSTPVMYTLNVGLAYEVAQH